MHKLLDDHTLLDLVFWRMDKVDFDLDSDFWETSGLMADSRTSFNVSQLIFSSSSNSPFAISVGKSTYILGRDERTYISKNVVEFDCHKKKR